MKKKLSKRILTMLLSMILCVSLIPAQAFGDTDTEFDAEETEKIVDEQEISAPAYEDDPTTDLQEGLEPGSAENGEATFDAFEETVSNDAALDLLYPVTDSGYCGPIESIDDDGNITYSSNLSWARYSDGTLVISGSGQMADWGYYYAPWSYVQEESGVHVCNVHSVIIEDSVTSIGSSAFVTSKDSLRNVTIGKSVTNIGNEAFSKCYGIQNVYYNGDLAGWLGISTGSLGGNPLGYDFENSQGCNLYINGELLTFAEIPSTVTSIRKDAFTFCSSLVSVEIPDSVTSIADFAFLHCDNLESITVDENNMNYSSLDGALFNKDKTTLIQYPGGGSATYCIPDSVTCISNYAIAYCTRLTEVTVPQSVTTIRPFVFWECESLTSVMFQGNAPTFVTVRMVIDWDEDDNAIYSNVYKHFADNMTVYYPAGNATWTTEIMQQFDKSITWKPDKPFLLDQTSITVKPDDRGYINCIVYDDSIGTIKWTSSNPEYVVKATALGSGRKVRLNGIKEGTATVTASVDGYSVSCEVTVEYPKLTIEPATVTMKPDETLKVYCYYDGEIISGAHWETSDWTIVQVSGLTSGGGEELEARKNGKATITATYEGKTATCEVSVESCKLTIDPATLTIDPDGTATVRCLADGKVVAADSWTSSNWDVVVTTGSYAKVEGLRAVGGGKATITAYYDGLTATCQVSVEETRLTINPAAVTVKPGESVEVSCLYNGEVVDASWSSTDIHTATVDSGGFGDSVDIEGVSNGKATIKAYYDGLTAACQVTVQSCTLTIEPQPLSYTTSDSYDYIKCKVDGDRRGVIQWKSSQEGVVRVIGSGTGENAKLEIYGPGTSIITASVDGISTSCQVTVTGDYTVEFDANNPYAYGAMYTITSETGSGEVLPDCEYISPGQEFTGWNTQRDGKGTTYAVGTKIDSMSSQNITLYAQWKDNVSYTLQYEAQDGTVLSTKTVSYSDTVIIDLPDYTVPGYTVCGWKIPNGKIFAPGECVSRLTNINGEIVHLTVQLSEDETEQAYVASGTYGSNLGWTLDDEGTLIISGSGIMEETWCENYPWYAWCGSIRKVIIEKGVTSIGTEAFASYYPNLKSVSIGSSINTIGELAFENSGLTSVTIPDCVEEIGWSAFADCTYLKSVSIGSGVSTIGDAVFGNCERLSSVTVSDENTSYCAVDSVIFNKDVTTLVQYPAGIAENTYEIPETVTEIGNYAFFGADTLTDLTLSDSITRIGDYAFEYCGITSINIPASADTIGTDPFYSCGSLTAINVAAENEYYSSVDGVLFNQLQSSVLRYPEGKTDESYEIPEGVTMIGEYAFRNAGFSTVTIPATVIRIADSSFESCSSLASLIIPDSVTEIGDSAFAFCTSLQSITLGSSLESLDRDAFRDCFVLASVTFTGSAPYFDCWGVFTDDVVTAYYPKNNETWTEDVMQDYGGTVTWKAYDPEVAHTGNVSGDDETSLIDLLMVKRSLADSDNSIDEVAADLNGDGLFNLKDLLMLKQQMASES